MYQRCSTKIFLLYTPNWKKVSNWSQISPSNWLDLNGVQICFAEFHVTFTWRLPGTLVEGGWLTYRKTYWNQVLLYLEMSLGDIFLDVTYVR